MYCKRNKCDYIKSYRIHGERRIKIVAMDTKWFTCDSTVSDYVFSYCRDIVDLMRRGLWEGDAMAY